MSTYIKPKIIRGLLEVTQADSALIVKIRKKKKTLGLVSKIQTNFLKLEYITSFSHQGDTLICMDFNALTGGFKGLS